MSSDGIDRIRALALDLDLLEREPGLLVEHVDLGDHVVRDRLAEHLAHRQRRGSGFAVVLHAVELLDLLGELSDALRARARDRLIRRRLTAPDPRPGGRRERHQRGDDRAVRHGVDLRAAFEPRVHLGDHELGPRLHPERARVVHADGAGLGGLRHPGLVMALRSSPARGPHPRGPRARARRPCAPGLGTAAACPPSAPRRAGSARRPGSRAPRGSRASSDRPHRWHPRSRRAWRSWYRARLA